MSADANAVDVQRLVEELLTEELGFAPGAVVPTDRPDADYGLGLAWRDTSCGVRVYGNDGDAMAYQAWTYATADGRRSVSLALTPDFSGDADDAVDAFVDRAVCGADAP